MVAIAHYDVHTDTWIRTGPDARQLWREAVQAVAEKAKEALPDSHGRIDQAVKLVLAGDVELLEDGTAKVASQSNGSVQYYVVNGACQCKDFAKAPANFCKHRLAYGLAKRATARMQDTMQAFDQAEQAASQDAAEDTAAVFATQAPAASPAVPGTLPEAPASANCYIDLHGRKVQVTLRGTDADEVLAKMARLLERYPMPETAGPVAELPEGWCPVHGTQMYWNEPRDGQGKGWWSHKAEDGTWCKGKRPQRRS